MNASADELSLGGGRRPEKFEAVAHAEFLGGDTTGSLELQEALEAAEERLKTLLAVGVTAPPDGQLRPDAHRLFQTVTMLRNRLQLRRLAEHHEAVPKIERALQRLGTATTVADFAAAIPKEVVNLGYLRALFSWVDEFRWVGHSAHSSNGPEEAKLFVQAAREEPFQDMRTLLEAEMLGQRRAILRQGVRQSPRIHPLLAPLTRPYDSYVAAPLVVNDKVVGFVSIDANLARGAVDQVDRDLLSLFCAGASMILERLRTQESLQALQKSIVDSAENLRAAASLLAHGSNSPITPAEFEGGAADKALITSRRDDGQRLSHLTRREEQVLRLLSLGLSNGEIADRLYIAEGTAKSHVKSILRKLGCNRIEAAAIYHHKKFLTV